MTREAPPLVEVIGDLLVEHVHALGLDPRLVAPFEAAEKIAAACGRPADYRWEPLTDAPSGAAVWQDRSGRAVFVHRDHTYAGEGWSRAHVRVPVVKPAEVTGQAAIDDEPCTSAHVCARKAPTESSSALAGADRTASLEDQPGDETPAHLPDELVRIGRSKRPKPHLAAALESADLRQHPTIVWDKTYFGMGAVFRNQYELIVHMSAGNPSPPSRRDVGNVISCPPVRSDLHPSEKPQPLLRTLLSVVAPPGGVVLDPCVGSGTTLLAAQALGLRSIGIESDERYCEVVAERLAAAPLPVNAGVVAISAGQPAPSLFDETEAAVLGGVA